MSVSTQTIYTFIWLIFSLHDISFIQTNDVLTRGDN